MAEWRYIYIRAMIPGKQGRRRLLERIKTAVQQERLALELPMVKIEVGSGSEFYFGLAVDSPYATEDEVPESVERIMQMIGSPLTDYDRESWPSSPDEVNQWLRGTFEWDSFTDPIVFEPALDLDEALQLAEDFGETEILTTVPIADRAEDFDKLLWWCTAKGEGLFQQLSEACNVLSLGDTKGGSWSVMRRLALLGHIEYARQPDGCWHWAAAPTVFVEEVANPGVCFIAGKRTDALTKSIRARLEVEDVAQKDGPKKLRVLEATPRIELALGLGQSVHSVGCAALELAKLVPRLDTWKDSLTPDPDVRPHLYQFERYHQGQFGIVKGGEHAPGLYRITRHEGPKSPQIRFLTSDARWLYGDFYGLRFLHHHATGQPCTAKWMQGGDLLMLAEHRWPVLYERALVLAGGLLPTLHGPLHSRVLRYGGITKELADLLCAKLDVDLEVSDDA